MKVFIPKTITTLAAALMSCWIPSIVFSQSLAAPAATRDLSITNTADAGTVSGSPPFLLNRGHPLKVGPFPLPRARSELPPVFSPTKPRTRYTPHPWKNDIVTTVFWVGESATRNNPVPNSASSWDTKWSQSFGGFDDPNKENRNGWLPGRFVPRQNPFYIALPYNDTAKLKTKGSAKKMIPWFKDAFYREGKSVVKGRWIAIRRGDKVCYGQWEDCGPFETDNWEYVFGDSRPRATGNGGAGLDVSPAIRDFLGFRWNARCDWRFVELHEIPNGPWKTWGNNNPFALRSRDGAGNVSESISKLRAMREMMLHPERPEPVKTVANDPGGEY